MHIARTRDFVDWEYQGTVFDESNRPSWATATSGLWAPDVRYVDGQYVIYFTVTDTTLNTGDDSAIGVATSPTPVGPWTPTDEPVVGPAGPGSGGFLWTFDPAMFTDVDGPAYLYFGSYNGGVLGPRLAADGLTAVGPATQVAINNSTRAATWFATATGTTSWPPRRTAAPDPATGYSVFSGRSRSPLGPFVDADGNRLLAPRPAAPSWSPRTATGGSVPATTPSPPTMPGGTGSSTTPWTATSRGSNEPRRHQPPADAAGPDRLDRRLAAGPRGRRTQRDPAAAPVTGTELGINSANPAAAGFVGLTAGPNDPAGRSDRSARGHGADAGRGRQPTPCAYGSIFEPTADCRCRLGDGARGVAVTVDSGARRAVLVANRGRPDLVATPTPLTATAGSILVDVERRAERSVCWLS